ncbi:glycosyltransferase [Salinimicrobium soli]|uniref:glycosyltransferase n=1 Tax=Salinimicrobium soli TaxID=1254399 RepID=UPI003AABD442
MISIIISSYRPNYFEQLQSNIQDTIGEIKYEIIKIHNPGLISLNSAYNCGARKSKFEYLLFLHEDILFLSNNWGKEIIRVLTDKSIGVVGVAGNEKKFWLPTGCETGIPKYRHVYVTHSPKKGIQNSHVKDPIKVRTLDGVFMAVRKSVWYEIKFDEKLGGFHFYDLDFSIRVGQHYQNLVLPAIRLQHFSLGNFGEDWIRRNLKFHKGNYDFDKPTTEEKIRIRIFWYTRLLKEKISSITKLRYIGKMGMGKFTWKYALRFLMK